MFLEGVSGVGKTSLVRKFVHQLRAEIPELMVLWGRCYERESVPFKALDGIVDAIANHGMAQSEAVVRSVLPENVTLLARLFPVLNRVQAIANQPLPPQEIIDPNELRRRAFRALRDLLANVARQRPLIVWIDDMQWSDEDSLLLLKALLEEPAELPALMILASRSAQGSEMPAFDWRSTLPGEHKTLCLAPLDRESSERLARQYIEQMIPGSASINPSEIASETQGHPLYISELVRFCAQAGTKTFPQRKLEEVILNRVMKLSDNERKLISYTCVAGSPMRGDFLRQIAKIDEAEFAASVSALKAIKLLRGKGVRKTDALEVYHDRVREAVMAHLLDKEKCAGMHRDIGRFLLSEYSEGQIENSIFEVVRHLNLGLNRGADESEKLLLFELNIKAGKRARAATAYSSAVEHFSRSLSLADERSWQSQYETMVSLYVAAAEAAYLSGDVSLSSSLVGEALPHVKAEIDRARLTEVQLLSLISQDKPDEAIALALGMGKRLGVRLPMRPSTSGVLWRILRTMWLLRGKSEADLLGLPVAEDENIKAAKELFAIIGSPAYLRNPKLWATIIAEAVQLSLKYGRDAQSPTSFVSYAVINCAMLGRYRYGYALGKMSVEMARRLEDTTKAPMVTFIFAQFVQHWADHLENTLPNLADAYTAGVEIGDLVYAAHGAANNCVHAFFCGKSLVDLAAAIEKYIALLKPMNMGVSSNTLFIYQRGIAAVRKPAADSALRESVESSLCDVMQLLIKDCVDVNLFHGHLMVAILAYMEGNSSAALHSIDKAKSYAESALGAYAHAVFPFYESLIALACCKDADAKSRSGLLKRAQKNQKKYKKTGETSPANHQHKYALVEAEIARVKGNASLSLALYAKAIEGAAENRFVQDAALACELAGECILATGDVESARPYLDHALEHYLRWGAMTKVEQLKKKYPALSHAAATAGKTEGKRA
ncbi:MAG: AAA family ATPase [Myxococcota bacterium]|nr:AAA family ATPase [Myxococcota bacterium]